MTADRLNATAASLLGFLHERPMTGWELVATAQRRIGDFWSITQSQVYRELARMAESGLVEAGRRGSRASQPYALTGAGRTAFEAWVDTVPARETIRFPLLLMLSFGRHLSPARRASFIERHRAMHAGQLARYEAEHDQITSDGEAADPFVEATLDFGISLRASVMDWFERLPPRSPGRADRLRGRSVARAEPPVGRAEPGDGPVRGVVVERVGREVDPAGAPPRGRRVRRPDRGGGDGRIQPEAGRRTRRPSTAANARPPRDQVRRRRPGRPGRHTGQIRAASASRSLERHDAAAARIASRSAACSS